MKKTSLKIFDGYKFLQAKNDNLGTVPDFRGEEWELLKDIALDVAQKATVRMWTHIYYKLSHRLTCRCR